MANEGLMAVRKAIMEGIDLAKKNKWEAANQDTNLNKANFHSGELSAYQTMLLVVNEEINKEIDAMVDRSIIGVMGETPEEI